MYVPVRFQAKDPELVKDFVRKNSFATLVSTTGGQMTATHTPLLWTNGERLFGHIARANPQIGALQQGDDVMAIFMEAHAYISSSWYEKVNVPTWNYIAVHIYGRPTVLEGEALYQAMKHMVDHYEGDRPEAFRIESMPEKMLQGHLAGIVGFEMSVDRIEASYKLSQNRNDMDYDRIIDELEKTGDALSMRIASEMRILRP